MTKAEILKQEILKQYKSVRQFALEMEIPYSTLVIPRLNSQNAFESQLQLPIFLQLNIIFHHLKNSLTSLFI